jgi:hypothetical protein
MISSHPPMPKPLANSAILNGKLDAPQSIPYTEKVF